MTYSLYDLSFSYIQVVIVACGITAQLGETERDQLTEHCLGLDDKLKKADIRVRSDLRDNYSPGWKFNHWELKVRLSIVKCLHCVSILFSVHQ